MDKKFDSYIEEQFGTLKTTKREFFPRNLSLTPEFEANLLDQINTLREQGWEDNKIQKQLCKAIPFFINKA